MSGVTGVELYEELASAASKAGQGLRRFVEPLSGNPSTFLDQLKQAKRPKPRTIERIRALLERRPIPPGQAPVPGVVTCTRAERERLGLPPSARMEREANSLAITAQKRSRVELQRDLTELAHKTRRPGQTLHDRVRELRRETVR